MFSGIVEASCRVLAVADRPGSRRLRLDLSMLRQHGRRSEAPAGAQAPLAGLGDSLAVQGCCLTVTDVSDSGATVDFDVVTETLARSTLGQVQVGQRLHVERSLRLGDSVDGHLVSGHIERTGLVLAADAGPGELRLTISCGADFAERLLPKGSVAVDGVSLTVAVLEADRFTVALVPHTLERTTLGERRPGDAVNLEPDQIGQWILRAAARSGPRA